MAGYQYPQSCPSTCNSGYLGNSRGTGTFIPVEPDKEVGLVLDRRRNQGRSEHHAKWKNLPFSRCAWLPEKYLEDIKTMVDEFEMVKQERSLGKRKRTRGEQSQDEAKVKKVKAG